MKSLDVFVGGVPLDQARWRNRGNGFAAVSGETKLAISSLTSDPFGKVWDVQCSQERQPYHLAVFCLGTEPDEWEVRAVGKDQTLLERPAMEIIHSVIADIRQKTPAHFLSFDSEI